MGMIRVWNRNTKIVAEYCRRLFELNLMLSNVLDCFPRVPFEFHYPHCTEPDRSLLSRPHRPVFTPLPATLPPPPSTFYRPSPQYNFHEVAFSINRKRHYRYGSFCCFATSSVAFARLEYTLDGPCVSCDLKALEAMQPDVNDCFISRCCLGYRLLALFIPVPSFALKPESKVGAVCVGSAQHGQSSLPRSFPTIVQYSGDSKRRVSIIVKCFRFLDTNVRPASIAVAAASESKTSSPCDREYFFSSSYAVEPTAARKGKILHPLKNPSIACTSRWSRAAVMNSSNKLHSVHLRNAPANAK